MLNKIIILVLIITLFSSSFANQYKFIDVEAYPIGYYNDKNKVDGVAIEVFRYIINKLGIDVELELGVPGFRVLQFAKKGNVDGIPFIRKTKEREEFLDYSKEAIFTENIMLYVRLGEEFDFSGDIFELKGKTIGVILGDSHGDKFNEAAKSFDIEPSRTLEGGFNKLLAGRIDVMISSEVRASIILKGMEEQNKIKKLIQPLTSAPLYVAFSKKSKLTSLRDEFDEMLAIAEKNGDFDEIMKKWE